MPSQQTVDTNGYLTVKACPLSSFGIFQYSAGQLGLTDRDPDELVNVYRPESEVSDPAAIASFQNLPFIDEHFSLSGFADADEVDLAPEDVGIDGILTGNVYYDAPWVRGDLKVFSRKLQRALAHGKRDLSLGYDCKYFLEKGEFNGQPYEVVQRMMRGNHIALVEEGRVPGARVLDGKGYDSLSFNIPNQPREETPVENQNQAQDSSPVETLRALLPQFAEAMKAFLGQEAGEAAHQEGGEAGAGAAEAGAAEAGAAAATGGEGEQSHQAKENEHLGAEVSNLEEKVEGKDNQATTDNDGDLVAMLEACLAKLKGGQEQTQTQETQGMDNVEGLNDQSKLNGAQIATDNSEKSKGDGSANALDEEALAGKAADAAVARIRADDAVKADIYDRLSPLVGAFNCRAMDSAAVVDYGLKKLGIKAEKGTERATLTAYIDGVNRTASTQLAAVKAADSAASGSGCDTINAYLKAGA